MSVLHGAGTVRVESGLSNAEAIIESLDHARGGGFPGPISRRATWKGQLLLAGGLGRRNPVDAYLLEDPPAYPIFTGGHGGRSAAAGQVDEARQSSIKGYSLTAKQTWGIIS